ncbi:glycerol kinase [Thioclava sp. SK-1]|nr:glycerol kinase [Thioclava sp. SK-1]
MRILALDQGTTSTRGLVVDTQGHHQAVFAARHKQYFPALDRVEHDPLEIVGHLRQAIAAAGPVDAIALSNQGESCLAWDAQTGEALSPILVWQDRRSEARLAQMRDVADMVRARSGLPLEPYFAAGKLGWLMQQPRVQAAHRSGRLRLGTTDAFFLQVLGDQGQALTDVSTASRSSLMNLAGGQWDRDLCQVFGVPIECLPPILPSVAQFATIADVPVTANIVDQQAALYGHGCRRMGQAKMTFGTGAFALALAKDCAAPPGGLVPTIAWHLPGDAPCYAREGGVHAAGAAVEWAMRIGLLDGPEALHTFDQPPAIDRGLVFVPALSGLACPHWDGDAAGLFIGMTGGTTRADMAQALVEGIALRAAEVLGQMGSLDQVSVDGGLSRSSYLVQFLADQIGADVVVPAVDELTGYGAAQLAALGKGGVIPNAEIAARVLPRAVDRAGRMARFQDALARAKGWNAP